MDRTKGILIAIDDSEGSRRAVAYVARMMGGRKGFRIRLFHVLAPLPPRLVDFPVGEDPGSTWRREAGGKDVRAAWVAPREKAARGAEEPVRYYRCWSRDVCRPPGTLPASRPCGRRADSKGSGTRPVGRGVGGGRPMGIW